MSVLDDPEGRIEALYTERKDWPEERILQELDALEPLPPEKSPEWQVEETWGRAQSLVAFGDVIAERQLSAAIGLILDNMSLGDPGEMMRGMRHSFEAAVGGDWPGLAEICERSSRSRHDGARHWAVVELGILALPSSLPTEDDE